MTLKALFALVVASLLVIAPGRSVAAEIKAERDRYMNCIVRISGLIENGDTQKLADVLSRLARTRVHQGLEPLEYDTARASNDPGYRICLDSPGGSYAEALRMADYIFEFMGTAVPRGARCLSACAVVFMAGSHNSESDAGTVANRLLHAAAELGFHAPSLVVEQGDYNEAAVDAAYKIAIASVGRLVERSRRFRASPSLLASMLQTPPDQMLMIETVFQAGHWDIPVTGTVRPERLDKRAVSDACNTHFAWELDRTLRSGTELSGARAGGEVTLTQGQGGTIAVQEDYGQEATLSCRIELYGGSPFAAIDENDDPYSKYGLIIIGEDIAPSALHPFMLYPGATPLKSLARPRDDAFAFADTEDFQIPLQETGKGMCYVHRDRTQLDAERCRFERVETIDRDLRSTTVTTYIWPSGSRTVSVDEPGSWTLNGAPTQMMFSDKPVNARCLLNKTSGNSFCFDED